MVRSPLTNALAAALALAALSPAAACDREPPAALAPAAAPEGQPAAAAAKVAIPNAQQPATGLLTGGQPSPAQLEELQASGYQVIVNLRPAREQGGYDEEAAARALGMTYYNLPVAGPGDVSEANGRELARILQEAGDRPTVVHCASGNRVGALFAMKARYADGQGADAALEVGRAHGLTSLTSVVVEKLGP